MEKFQFVEIQNRFKTDPGIAKYLGVSVQYVRRERKRLGIVAIKKTTVNIERNNSIIHDFLNGKMQVDIAKKNNLTRVTIYKILKSFKGKSGKNVAD